MLSDSQKRLRQLYNSHIGSETRRICESKQWHSDKSHSEWLIIEEMIAMQFNCKLEGLLGDML